MINKKIHYFAFNKLQPKNCNQQQMNHKSKNVWWGGGISHLAVYGGHVFLKTSFPRPNLLSLLGFHARIYRQS
uniref:Uncharacterized protein n=1 Tax=Rhizophora mucronata TaxID=61149 RepID=A0A2P2N3H6_RHIMU